MKKQNRVSFFFTVIVLFSTSTRAAIGVPSWIKNITSLDKVQKIIRQKAQCLARGNPFLEGPTHCSRRDTLTLTYALGFLWGAHVPIAIVKNILLSKDVTKSTYIARVAQGFVEKTLIDQGIRGILLTPITRIALINVLSIAHLFGDANLLFKASTSTVNFLHALRIIMTENIKCIWSEKYCDPLSIKEALFPPAVDDGAPTKHRHDENPRRLVLYFWLGFLSGHIIHTLIKATIPSVKDFEIGTTWSLEMKNLLK